MPAFSAIGLVVAEALIGGGFATAAAAAAAGAWGFVAVASVAAMGAAYITSRIINGNPNKGSLGASNSGGRIQLPPATNNKIPVLYGSAFINGVLTDARLISTDKSKNDVMYYSIVLSETTNDSSTAYTIDGTSFSGGGVLSSIYWNDEQLVFDDTAGAQHKVIKGVKTVETTNDTINENYKDNLEIRVYAGDGTSAKQIWPPQASGDTANAWNYWPNDDANVPYWDSTHRMEGFVFAIVRLKYNADKGFTNLAPVTFKVTNTVSNPALVLADYMQSDRYGANIPLANLNYDEFVRWYNYCEELITFSRDGTNTTQKRASINGMIDTNNSVKQNIDNILLNGNAWMSYDVSSGLWRPIIQKAINAGSSVDSSTHFNAAITGNTTLTVTDFPSGRIEAGQQLYKTDGTYLGTIVQQITPLTSGETTGQKGRYQITSTTNTTGKFYTVTSNLLQFNDDNIISGIGVSSTRLDDLYNAFEVEYFDRNKKDQKNYARDQLPNADRNPTEPDNTLRIGLDLSNNSAQANMIGQIQLRQSRDDLVVDFTSSFYGIQAQAGDVIAITNSLYNWNPKLFRVMRVKEIEGEDGSLSANIQALEYNDDVYTIENLTEFTIQPNIGIPPIYSGGDNANLQTPNDDLVVVAMNTDNTAAVPYIVLSATIPYDGGPYDEIQVWNAIGPDPEVAGQPSAGSYTLLDVHKPPSPQSIFENGRAIVISSITSGNVCNTSTAHGLTAGMQLLFIDADNKGFVKNTIYWILADGLTATAFKVATTDGGAPVTLTTGTGFALNFTTTHAIYITALPGNAAGQKYYFKIRVGLQNRYGPFTSPDAAVVPANPTTSWNPGGSAAGFFLQNAQEGQTIYYNADVARWMNTSILKINDTTNAVEINSTSTESFAVVDTSNTTQPMAPLKLRHTTTGTPVAGFGTTLTFEAENAAHANKTIGYMDFIYDDITGGSEDARWRVGLLSAGVEPSYVSTGPGIELDSQGNLFVDKSIRLVGPNNTSSPIGITGAMAGTVTPGTGTADYWHIGGYSESGTGANDGALEIATSNNGNEPIYVRQYTGGNHDPVWPGTALDWPKGATVVRTLTLLDGSGNTTLPGDLALPQNITASSINPLTLTRITSNTSATTRAATLKVTSTGTPAVGLGTSLEFSTETAANVYKSGGYLSTRSTNVTTGSESFDLDILLMKNNAVNTIATFNSSGDLTLVGDLTVAGNDIKSSGGTTAITLSAADVTVQGDIQINGNDIKSSTGNSAITLYNKDVTVHGNFSTDNGGGAYIDGVVQINGSCNIQGAVYESYAMSLSSGTTVISSVPASTFNMQKFIVTILGSSGSTVYRQSVEIMLTHDYTPTYNTMATTYINYFGDIKNFTGDDLVTFSADWATGVVGPEARLKVTTSYGGRTIRVIRITG